MFIKAYTFFKNIYSDNKTRTQRKRTLSKDLIQFSKNLLRLSEEKKLIREYFREDLPVIYIVGVPRSGTTLLSQLMIYQYDFAYISNQIVKYWITPVSRFREILKHSNSAEFLEFDSELGNTSGLNSPHEFGWFWQYWLNHKNSDVLSKKERQKVDWEGIRKEVGGICGINNKALLIKNLVYNNFIINELSGLFSNSFFIHVERNPIETINSIYQARIKTYQDPKIWWSIKPQNYSKWLKLGPIEQITHQYFSTLISIDKQLESLQKNSYEVIHYSDLISKTNEQLKKLEEKFGFKSLEKPIQAFNKKTEVPTDLESEIKNAIDKIAAEYVSMEKLSNLMR